MEEMKQKFIYSLYMNNYKISSNQLVTTVIIANNLYNQLARLDSSSLNTQENFFVIDSYDQPT